MDVLMPDGTLVKNVPEGTTKAELQAKLGGVSVPKEESQRSLTDYAKAAYEVPTALARGAIDPILANAYGIAKSIPEALRTGQPPAPIGQEIAQNAMQKMQYQPESPVTKDVLGAVGSALEATKLPPYMGNIGAIPSAIQAGNIAKPMMQADIQAAKPAINNMANALRSKVTVEAAPTMAGVGAAEVPEAVNRAQMAQQLRVPVNLSKGQALRDLSQQKFEIETPKEFPELGKPLIEAQAKRNDNILQNFDAYVDATGKETYGLRETGRVVDKALVNAANKAKSEINAAYTAARDAGETQQPVPYAPLKAYIDEQTPTVKRKLAPIISAVDEEIQRNDPSNKTGQISINSLEDIYQFINKNYEPGTVGETHAKAMKNIINQMTEGQGGELYQEARKLRTKFGREFENVGYVDKLLRTKPGTTDRAVAFEDVFDHSVLNGSLDDVRAIGMTLKKAGPEGQQAWKELQGQTIQYIKDQVTKNSELDAFDNPIVSPAKFKAVVTTLDQDGKLDYVFGKKGAQEIRDLYQTNMYVNKPLRGAENYPNTSSAIITALDKIGGIRIPGVSNVAKFAAEKGKKAALKKQIKESIEYNPMAEALRKTK